MTDGDVDSKKKFNDNVAINLEKAGEKINQQFCTMLICISILDSFCPEDDHHFFSGMPRLKAAVQSQ